jgi:CRISPR-associated protein Cas2
MQPERPFYLAAYDISHNYRRSKARQVLKAYSYSGQRSVFECYLTDAERQEVIRRLLPLIGCADRFFLLRLDPRSRVLTLGRAVEPQDPPFFYVG